MFPLFRIESIESNLISRIELDLEYCQSNLSLRFWDSDKKKFKILLLWKKRFLRFDIKMEFILVRPKSKTQGWSNLVHFTCGFDCAKIGDRIPGNISYLIWKS